jgi:hypothetical protein
LAKQTVDFTLTHKSDVKAYEIDVGLEIVPINNDEGSLAVESGVEQLLVWRFTGDPGAKLAIVGKVGEATVVEVKESTIPPQRIHGAGYRPFTIKASAK